MTTPVEHSVALIEELCIGCTACVKACPTEAIRVRENKARIMEERCIDCGVCITTCPVHAKVAYTNLIHDIYKYRYRIVLVPPEIFGQFPDELSPESILFGIKKLGFHEVHELSPWMERVSAVQRLYFGRNSKKVKRPLISFLCPAVVRLIAVRFPSLIDNVIPIRTPMGAAAKWLSENKPKELGLRRGEIGIFLLTPCPAQMTRIKNPLTDKIRYLDGAISISDVFGDIFAAAQKMRKDSTPEFKSRKAGLLWGVIGGESRALELDNVIWVDGMDHVVKILEAAENGKLFQFDFLECRACTGGCVGGPLMVENVFLAANRLQRLARRVGEGEGVGEERTSREFDFFKTDRGLSARPIDALAANPVEAIEKMRERKQVLAVLPKIDCGACGAPSCEALAEDVIQGRAKLTDCIFVLFEQARAMSKRVFEWTDQLPASLRPESEKLKAVEKIPLSESPEGVGKGRDEKDAGGKESKDEEGGKERGR